MFGTLNVKTNTIIATTESWGILAMSPQLIKSRFSFSASALRGISLPVSIVLLLSSGSATALHASVYSVGPPAIETGTYNQGIQLISQTEEESTPPEIIVETEPQDSDSTTSTSTNTDPRFTCQFVNGEYMVMYHPESQPDQAYPWAVPSQLGGGWTSERRCYEISRRLEFYRSDGLLELSTSVENNYEIICVTTQKDPNCRIVLTVPPGKDAELTRDRIFQNLVVADSGQQTQGVNTFVEGNQDIPLLNQIDGILNTDLSTLGERSSGPSPSSPSLSKDIDLRPFLDPADGGTGTRLRGNKSMPSNHRQLNPDNFR
ncbi:MAG: COP23 domain-containing protein [Xenococcaceae cyanobacterium]